MSQRNVPGLGPAPTKHAKLVQWVREVAELTQPDRVRWCDGSEAEWTELTDELVAAGGRYAALYESWLGNTQRA